jgi:alpha-1,6-mannosyltransferase
MRIVQLANFYGGASGGLRTVLNELGARYAEAGHDVFRIVAGERDSTFDAHGVRTIVLRAPKVPGMGGYRAIVDQGRVEMTLQRLAPDIIELSDKTTLVHPARRVRRGRAVVVLISHERLDAILRPRCPRWFPLEHAADRVNRRLASNVDAVVCSSRFACEEFSRIGVDPVCIPLGVDLEMFNPRQAVAPDGRAHVPTIVCVGRLSAEKKPQTAIEAVRQLARRGVRTRLMMIGDGPMRTDLERLAAGLDVRFAGHIGDRSEVAAALRTAEVAIAPCPFETFGLAALEALAAGTPVVVPNAGALAELVVDGSGVAVSDSPTAFADGIAYLLGESRSSQRTIARRRAEEFSWTATSESYLALFEQAAEGATGALVT